MNTKKFVTKNVIAIILNLFIIGATVYSIYDVASDVMAFGGGKFLFRYFTIDSNLLMSFVASAAIFFNISNIRFKKNTMPLWFTLIKFAATCAVTLTFLVVMLFLWRIYGLAMLLEGGNLFMHMITPLVALFLFVFIEKSYRFKLKYFLFGIIPTIIYGIVYIVCVLLVRCWPDFYGFNQNGMWYVMLPIMLAGSTLIAFLVCLFHNIGIKKQA